VNGSAIVGYYLAHVYQEERRFLQRNENTAYIGAERQREEDQKDILKELQ
jgi:hypothetical protein